MVRMEPSDSTSRTTDDEESKRHSDQETTPEKHGDRRGSSNRPDSLKGGLPRPKERGRVRFNSTSEVNDEVNQRFSFPLRDNTFSSPIQPPKKTVANATHFSDSSLSTVVRHSLDQGDTSRSEELVEARTSSPLQRPQAPILRNNSASLFSAPPEDRREDAIDGPAEKKLSALAAQKRGERMATSVGSPSALASRRNSVEEGEEMEDDHLSPPNRRLYPVRMEDIPLLDIGKRPYNGTDSESDDERELKKSSKRTKTTSSSEAHKIVQAYTRRDLSNSFRVPNSQSSGFVSGQVTPIEEQAAEHYVARPQEFRGGVLSSLLKLYHPQITQSEPQRTSSVASVPSSSPLETSTPRASCTNTASKQNQKWYKQNRHNSNPTLTTLVEASTNLGQPASGVGGTEAQGRSATVLSAGKRSPHGRLMDSTMGKIIRPRLEDEIRVTIHIAETLSRQKYLIRLCKALMSYGAPTHRLEEYLKMTARVLETEAQFLYIPGCMLISFDDSSTHTTDVKLVRTTQGVDLGKLKDVHEIYKEVVHDVIGVEEATQRLDAIMRKKQKNNRWLLVLIYGLASASVGPFAFEARLIDLPICFILGCLLGILQLIVAPKSDLYSNVFEISATVLTSFLARAFGSIPYGDGTLFCFSAMAQSSIALILPGYMVLCGSLELQSKSIVAGSVRMVYAIIYSLFLGFGITIGTAIYGLIDQNATSNTICSAPMNEYYRFFFVPIFTLCLCIINQAKWKQIPVMLAIAFVGYVVNFFSAKKFPSSAQISNTLGALAVGVLGNLYSRMRHGLAAAALLPAIFVQVPSGLAASGSLLAGLTSADQLTNSSTYANGTVKINGTSSVSISPTDVNSVVLNVGYSMIQVAIGITVGLFLSALIVYPLGKRRSGLFSF